MKNRSNVVIITIGVVVAALVAWLILRNQKGFSWYETLDNTKMQPYDLKLFTLLIDEASPGAPQILNNPIKDELPGRDSANYIFIGQQFYLDTTDARELLNFVARGNDAFIASYGGWHELVTILEEQKLFVGYTSYEESMSAKVRFGDTLGEPQYTFSQRDKYGPVERYWSYFEDPLDTNPNIKPLSYFKNEWTDEWYINAYQINIGKGHIYWHIQPFLFTNYFINEDEGYQHAKAFMTHLNKKPALWDNYHQEYYTTGSNGLKSQKSPLRFVLDHPPLRYAWYTLLAACLLFIIFRGKRQQRIIPLLPQMENTSIAFAKSLGTLYYQSDSGRYLATEMMQLFNNFNRRRYRINRKKTDEDISAILAKKARVPESLLHNIFKTERKIIYNPNAKVGEVAELYALLEEYYNKARK